MELKGNLQILSKNGLSVSNYMLKVKTLSDHLASIGEIIPECDPFLYILNDLCPQYLTFLTIFNMTQIHPSIGILHNQLDNFERMLLVSKIVHQEYVV